MSAVIIDLALSILVCVALAGQAMLANGAG
jgi:hypothetical protein